MTQAIGVYLAPGFPGMKATAERTNVRTIPSSATVAPPLPGCAVVAIAGKQVAYGTALAKQVGVALYDGEYAYLSSAFVQAQTGIQSIPINVQTDGPVWVRVSGANGATVTPGLPAKYVAADGTFSDQGTITIPNAVFRSGIETGTSLEGFGGDLMAVVELNTPFVNVAGV
jgi:hypothetical protein